MSPLLDADIVRFPYQATTRPLPFKEWQHFVIQNEEVRILVNFSLLVESQGAASQRLSPQTIVLIHGRENSAALDRVKPENFAIAADLRGMAIGNSQMTMTADGYHVTIDSVDGSIQADLTFEPTSRPFIVNNQPVGDGRLSWLFVPQLVASGWIATETQTINLNRDAAYHDHNWGHMKWGDDFSWMWGSVLPTAGNDWTFVVMRMTDRNCHRTFAQALYAWHGAEPVGMYRDHAVTITQGPPFPGEATDHLPPVTRMLSGSSSDVPSSMTVAGSDGESTVSLVFTPESFSRIAFPSEVDADRLCILDEASGDVQVSGYVGDQALGQTSRGFFEFCHG